MAAPISGKMLKDVRGQRGLSQQGLAESSGVGIATIKRIESSQDIYSARQTSANRLAAALEVEVHDLCEDTFSRIIDIGQDLELHLGLNIDIPELRKSSDRLIELAEVRNRILKT